MKKHYKYFEEKYEELRCTGKKSWQTKISLQWNLLNFKHTLKKNYVPKNGNFLELGCGDGEITLFFSSLGYNSYGVDISPTAIGWADEKSKRRNINANFINDNVLTLTKLKEEYFDVIIDGACFHCILDSDRNKFLASAYKVLKTGGFCQFRTICGELTDKNLLEYYDKLTKNVKCYDENNFQYFHQGVPEDIITEVKNAGFVILNTELHIRDPKGSCDLLIIDTIKAKR